MLTISQVAKAANRSTVVPVRSCVARTGPAVDRNAASLSSLHRGHEILMRRRC